MKNRIWKAATTAARLGCPRCGARTLFRGAFKMNEQCARCGLRFEREPGYFVGAIYMNYAATVLPIVAGFLLLDAYTDIGLGTQLLIWSAAGIILPLVFYRYSRSCWLALDHLLSPEERPLQLTGHGSRSNH
jgi:uncharacterized protein (DUF983 family)